MKQLIALVAFVLSIPVSVLGQDSAGVFLEPEALTAAPPQLVLNLFDDATFAALIDEVSPTDAGYALTGRLDGVALGPPPPPRPRVSRHVSALVLSA